MGLFNFNQNDSLRYSQSKQAKRDRRIQEGLKSYSESLAVARDIEAAKRETEAQMFLEEKIGSVVNKSIVNRRRHFRETSRLQESLIKKLLASYLTETTIKGLVFDDYFIKENCASIRNESNKIFNKLFEENVLNESLFKNSKSILLQEAYEELKSHLNSVIDQRELYNVYTENTLLAILDEAKKSKDLSEEIADNVKEKVTETLEKEKKISKKKEEEKKKDEEEKEAAESLDNDVDKETGEGNNEPEEPANAEGGQEPAEPNAEGGQEPNEPADLNAPEGQEPADPNAQDGQEPAEPNAEGEEPSDEPTEPNADPNAQQSEVQEPADPNAQGGQEPAEPNAEGQQDPNAPQGQEPAAVGTSASTGKGVNIQIDSGGTKISIAANEAVEYLNLFGKRRYRERNAKTLFRNMLESNLNEQVSMLKESKLSTINMDNVLAETIIQYTLLETLYTARLFDLNPKQIKSLSKTLNFIRE